MPKLIDADALLKMICELCGGECKAEDKENCAEWDLTNSAINRIDAVEVVRWCGVISRKEREDAETN